jgi:hypothetical protein
VGIKTLDIFTNLKTLVHARVKSKCIKEILLNMNKEIKNMKFIINQIEWKSKQHLMKKLDEGKWTPKPFLGMCPFLPWCAPTPTLVNKERK